MASCSELGIRSFRRCWANRGDPGYPAIDGKVMNLLAKQIAVKDKIVKIATAMGIDPVWAVSVAMVESSLGVNQKSPTGC